MIPAQEWYNYQEQYEKYGLDFGKEKKKRTPKPAGKKRTKVTAKDRMRIMLATAVIGVLLLGVIVMSAYSAVIKFNISDINNENEALKGEVETLRIRIQSNGNIEKIEAKATKKLGMSSPSSKKCVRLKN